MNTYKLLTPGPLTTTDTVKEEMLVDRCTWDDDYKAVTQKIRRQLLQLGHVSEDDYTAVLMQGSGTFGVESVLSSVVGDEDKVLICSNGAYGVRMTRICDRNRIPYVHYAESYDHIPDPARVARLLAQDPAITHVAMVHSETTSGILNDIQSVGKVVRDAGRTFIVDAMSSFGGVDIPVSDWGIDFLVSSANKCIQGVPGFSFILCRRDKLLSSEGKGVFRKKTGKPEKKERRKEPETEEKPEHTDKKGKLKRYWKIAQNSLSVLPKPLRRLWKGLSLRHLIVGVQVGRFDAKECALAYGAANAAVYAAVGLLSSAMRVHLEQLTVQCAFGQERSRWVIRGRLHFCPLSALLALGSFAMGYVMQKNRQEDAEKEPAAEKEHAAAR